MRETQLPLNVGSEDTNQKVDRFATARRCIGCTIAIIASENNRYRTSTNIGRYLSKSHKLAVSFSLQVGEKIADLIGDFDSFKICHMRGCLHRSRFHVILINRQKVQNPGKCNLKLGLAPGFFEKYPSPRTLPHTRNFRSGTVGTLGGSA